MLANIFHIFEHHCFQGAFFRKLCHYVLPSLGRSEYISGTYPNLSKYNGNSQLNQKVVTQKRNRQKNPFKWDICATILHERAS